MAGVTIKVHEDIEKVPDQQLIGFFDSATNNLIDIDERPPVIDQEQKQHAMVLSNEIGKRDGRRPGTAMQSTQIVLPAEDLLRNHAHSVLDRIGALAAPAIQRSRLGKPLTWHSPADAAGTQGVWNLIRENFLTVVIVTVSGVIEYLVGVQYTQRVFNLGNTEAHVMAVAIAVGLACIAVFAAAALHRSVPGLGRRLLLGFATFLIVDVVVFALLGGSILSKLVENPETATVTGDGTEVDQGALFLFRLVTTGTYMALVLGLFVLVLVAHLLDVLRTADRETREIHERQKGLMGEQRVAAGNSAYLQVFLNLYDELVSARKDIIASYVTGVRGILDPTMAGPWDSSRISVGFEEPGWVQQIRDEIAYAERRAAQPVA